MKKIVTRLSPHQNGKVFAVLMAATSLLFCVPFSLIMFFVVPDVDEQGNLINFRPFVFLVFPIVYLVFGYFSIVMGSAVYNFLYRHIGGFEFEVRDQDT